MQRSMDGIRDYLNQKIDGVEQKLEKKIDSVRDELGQKIDPVAVDLSAHRADTESHRTGYRISESRE